MDNNLILVVQIALYIFYTLYIYLYFNSNNLTELYPMHFIFCMFIYFLIVHFIPNNHTLAEVVILLIVKQ